MTPHEEFLELCAAATAGELNPGEQANLEAHLAECAECRKAMREFEIASRHGVAALASELAPEKTKNGSSWSVEKAEEAFLKRLDKEAGRQTAEADKEERTSPNRGQRFTYRPSPIRWREVWMPFAAAVLLAVALSIAAYRTGIKRGADVARTVAQPVKESENSLEAQVSDAGHERAQLAAKLNQDAKVIDELKRQLSEQSQIVSALKSMQQAPSRPSENNQQNVQRASAG